MRTYILIRDKIAKFFRNLIPKIYLVKNLKGDTVIISSSCRVCRNIERNEIDRRLTSAKVLKEVSETYRIDLKELAEHYANHVVGIMENRDIMNRLFRKHFVRYLDLQEELLKLIDRLNSLFKMLERFDEGSVDMLKSKPTPRDYIASIDGRRKIIEDIRKTLSIINELKKEVRTEKDLTDLFRMIEKRDSEIK